jgi:hypothetical protein
MMSDLLGSTIVGRRRASTAGDVGDVPSPRTVIRMA